MFLKVFQFFFILFLIPAKGLCISLFLKEVTLYKSKESLKMPFISIQITDILGLLFCSLFFLFFIFWEFHNVHLGFTEPKSKHSFETVSWYPFIDLRLPYFLFCRAVRELGRLCTLKIFVPVVVLLHFFYFLHIYIIKVI